MKRVPSASTAISSGRRAIAVASFALVLTALSSGVSAENTLRVGDDAPALDIEHYLQDGNGFFPKVEKFEKGKVYVIEFWATWCNPCIQSMPHLAELQKRYRGENVQIISVSDEDLATVKTFLEREYPGDEDTFAELTSAYTLTTDPDQSTSKDYMLASGQQGIPSSFLVGKTGKIEWIGHPMSLDDPLEQVVKGTWDREAFMLELERAELMDTAMRKIQQLAGAGKFDDAIKVIDQVSTELKNADDASAVAMLRQLEAFRFNLRLDSGDQSEEVMEFFEKQLEQAKETPQELAQFAYGMMASAQQGTELGSLGTKTLMALEESAMSGEAELKPLLFVVKAQLHASMQQFDQAIASQEKAIDAAEGQQKAQLTQMLEQLKAMVAAEKKKAAAKQSDVQEDSEKGK